MLDLVEFLRPRLTIGHFAQSGKLLVDQPGFQPGGEEIGLENNVA